MVNTHISATAFSFPKQTYKTRLLLSEAIEKFDQKQTYQKHLLAEELIVELIKLYKSTNDDLYKTHIRDLFCEYLFFSTSFAHFSHFEKNWLAKSPIDALLAYVLPTPKAILQDLCDILDLTTKKLLLAFIKEVQKPYFGYFTRMPEFVSQVRAWAEDEEKNPQLDEVLKLFIGS